MPRKQESESGRFEKAPETKQSDSCAAVTNGRRCYLPGGMSPYIGEGIPRYCHWHYVCLRMPAHMQTFEEFERWQEGWQGYCSPENHHSNPDLWDAIQGRKPLGKPRWCGVLWCRHMDIASPEVQAAIQDRFGAIKRDWTVRTVAQALEFPQPKPGKPAAQQQAELEARMREHAEVPF